MKTGKCKRKLKQLIREPHKAAIFAKRKPHNNNKKKQNNNHTISTSC